MVLIFTEMSARVPIFAHAILATRAVRGTGVCVTLSLRARPDEFGTPFGSPSYNTRLARARLQDGLTVTHPVLIGPFL